MLVEYLIYEVEAIEYARKQAKDNNVGTHVVISPFDKDDQETKDYLEYELGGLEPYEVIWESFSEDVHASTSQLSVYSVNTQIIERSSCCTDQLIVNFSLTFNICEINYGS